MKSSTPLISVAVPVYNGENFLAEALDSLLAQTVSDIEIIVSDNASTDQTPEIAQSYALEHPRVKYFRHEENLGAGPNFNSSFKRARGQYFKWHAHDDLVDPLYLERCVAALECHPKAILCFTQTRIVDSDGDEIEIHRTAADTHTSNPSERFRNILLHRGQRLFEIYGLIRREELGKTELFTSHALNDRALLAELSLMGPFLQLQEALFTSRIHPEQSTWQHPTPQSRGAWVDSKLQGHVTFPEWSAFIQYQRSLLTSSLRWNAKLSSQMDVLRYLNKKKGPMLGDLKMAWKKITGRTY